MSSFSNSNKNSVGMLWTRIASGIRESLESPTAATSFSPTITFFPLATAVTGKPGSPTGTLHLASAVTKVVDCTYRLTGFSTREKTALL